MVDDAVQLLVADQAFADPARPEKPAWTRKSMRTMSGPAMLRAMAAVCQASVPWCSIIVRKVFGVAGAAHQNSGRYNLRYVWPSGEWGSLPIAGGLEAAYKADIEAAADPAARMAEIETRLKALTSPFRSAESFIVEEIIDPRDTRRLLCEFADLAAPLRTPGRTAFGIRP